MDESTLDMAQRDQPMVPHAPEIQDQGHERTEPQPTRKANNSGSVQIRLAKTAEDLQALAEIGVDAVAESPTLSRYAYDAERMWRKAQDRLKKEPNRHALIIAELDGKLVGFLWAQVGGHLFVDARSAQCLVFYVSPEHRNGLAAIKLLKGYQRWAEQQGCDTIALHVTSGARMKTTDRLLRKMGFTQVGGNYEKGMI